MNDLSLYLHIPFCHGKCHYCDFYSLSAPEYMRDYEKALCQSLASFSSKAEGYQVKTVYFGGGTPSLLSKKGVEEIFAALKKGYHLLPDAEITVEMNPESASEEILSTFFSEGANRVSFGMQSALDDELLLLGRRHRYEDVKRAVERARKTGFENISLDLMYGLPGQTPSDFRESVQKAISLSPQHLSFYLLTLSENVPLYEKRGLISSDEVLRNMYFEAIEIFSRYGFFQYEISNAAIPGFESRHNKVYWEGGEYLGFGPGAHSLFQNRRFSQEEDLKKFLLNPHITPCFERGEERSKEDILTEYLMLSLRQKKGISFEKLSLLADENKVLKIFEKMSLWEKHGLCEKTKIGYALTPEGFFVSSEMISELL